MDIRDENFKNQVVETLVYAEGGKVLVRCCDPDLKEYRVKRGTEMIKNAAFIGCDSLETVFIPNTVHTIGSDAFYRCKNLRCVIIEEGSGVKGRLGLYEIKAGAFSECPNLQEIELPESLDKLGDLAFAYCFSLRELTLPKYLSSMGDNPFAGCNIRLKNKTWNFKVSHNMLIENHKLIGFLKNSEIVKIPDCITSIGNYAFDSQKNLKMVILPKQLSTIGKYAFYGCSSLIYVDTRQSEVNKIGEYAFNESGLSSFTFPDGLEEIGEYAFSNCKRLSSVYKRGNCKIISSENDENTDDEEEEDTSDNKVGTSDSENREAHYGFDHSYYEGNASYFGYGPSMFEIKPSEKKKKCPKVCKIRDNAFKGCERVRFIYELRIKS